MNQQNQSGGDSTRKRSASSSGAQRQDLSNSINKNTEDDSQIKKRKQKQKQNLTVEQVKSNTKIGGLKSMLYRYEMMNEYIVTAEDLQQIKSTLSQIQSRLNNTKSEDFNNSDKIETNILLDLLISVIDRDNKAMNNADVKKELSSILESKIQNLQKRKQELEKEIVKADSAREIVAARKIAKRKAGLIFSEEKDINESLTKEELDAVNKALKELQNQRKVEISSSTVGPNAEQDGTEEERIENTARDAGRNTDQNAGQNAAQNSTVAWDATGQLPNGTEVQVLPGLRAEDRLVFEGFQNIISTNKDKTIEIKKWSNITFKNVDPITPVFQSSDRSKYPNVSAEAKITPPGGSGPLFTLQKNTNNTYGIEVHDMVKFNNCTVRIKLPIEKSDKKLSLVFIHGKMCLENPDISKLKVDDKGNVMYDPGMLSSNVKVPISPEFFKELQKAHQATLDSHKSAENDRTSRGHTQAALYAMEQTARNKPVNQEYQNYLRTSPIVGKFTAEKASKQLANLLKEPEQAQGR